MIPYLVLIFVPIIYTFSAGVRSMNENKRSRRTILLFFAILLFLLMFRSIAVGRDLGNYFSIFNKSRYSSLSDILVFLEEPAYGLLNKAIGAFTGNFQWVIVITSIITILPIAYVYKKETVYPGVVIALFVAMSTFVMLFSGLRQCIAIALGMLAYICTKKHKFIPYILLVILAFLFHRSAFMLLFMYPVYHVRITKKWLWFLVPILALIFVFNKPIFSILASLVSDLYEGGISSTGAYTMLVLFLIFCVFSFVIPEEEKLDESTIGMRNFLLLATVIQMFAPLNSLAMRMGYYYIIFIPLVIPRIIQCASIRWRKIAEYAKYIMVLFFIVYFLISAPKANVLDTFPYQFFWEGIA